MKKALYLIIHLAVASLAGVAAAATVELMPDIGAMTGQGYNSAGRLAGDGITGDDVKNWLGSRADGWYTTTGNGDMRWGNATSNTEDQTINLPSMNGTAGVCFGLKMTIENIQDYSGLSFSMNLTPSGTTGTYTYSVWYETRDGEMVELCKGTRNNDGSPWNVHYDLTEDQLRAMKENGGELTRQTLAEALKATEYEGVTGTVTFDDNGDWVRDYLTLTVKDGKYVLYEE